MKYWISFREVKKEPLITIGTIKYYNQHEYKSGESFALYSKYDTWTWSIWDDSHITIISERLYQFFLKRYFKEKFRL